MKRKHLQFAKFERGANTTNHTKFSFSCLLWSHSIVNKIQLCTVSLFHTSKHKMLKLAFYQVRMNSRRSYDEFTVLKYFHCWFNSVEGNIYSHRLWLGWCLQQYFKDDFILVHISCLCCYTMFAMCMTTCSISLL